MKFRAGAVVVALLTSMVVVSVGVPASAAQTVELLVPLAPARILDTRSALGADGPVGPDSSISLDVTGVGGVPDSGVGAVVLNVTAAEATADTWLTVFPHGQAMPETSNLNVTEGFVTANTVVATVGDGGLVDLYNFAGSVELIADVTGWLPVGGGYTGFAPQRVLDTRVSGQPVGPGAAIDVQLTGRAGVPASGVGAVVVGVTATESTEDTFLTVWPSDQARPTMSNLNPRAGRNASNAVVATLSADGRISVYNSTGSTHVVVDVFGWLPTGVGFDDSGPTRILDTRSGLGLPGPVGPHATISLHVTGVGGVPTSDVGAVVLNLTASHATEPTFVTMWPSGLARPTASILNPAPGSVPVANLVVAVVGADGSVELYNDVGNVHLIVDVLGWFSASTALAMNQSPVAVDDSATTDEDSAVDIAVLANDSDADGDALVVSAVGAPGTGGAAAIASGGSAVSFDPGSDFDDLGAGESRSSAFTYTVSDGTTTDTATVTVTVTGVAEDPIAVDDTATVVEDSGANAIDALANDTDIDGGPKTIVTVTQPANGTVVITGGGTGLTYQPVADTCGTDPFTYTLNGGSTGTVTVTVTCVNDGPTLATTATALAYDEDDGAVEVDPGLTVTDDGTISGATVQIGAGFMQAEDALAFNNQLGITGNYNNATGTLTLSGAASAANYQTALRSVTYTNNSQSPTTATRTVSFQVTDDGALASNIASRDITVASINDVPALTTAPGATTYTENGPAVTVDATLIATDADDTNIESAVVEISIGFQAGDELIFIDTASIAGTYNTGTGVLTLTGADTVANYQTALRSITFSTPSDDPSAARTIRFTVNDGDNASNPATRGIAITAVNDAPVNNLPGAVSATPAGGTAWTADISGSIADPDSQGNDEQVTLQVVSGALTLSGTTGLSFTAGDGTADATMTFTGSLADINAAISVIAYSVDPAPASDTLTITTNDLGNAGTPGSLTDIDTVAISFNQSPVVTTNAVGTTAYTEGGPAAAVDPALTVTDTDDTNLAGATIEVSVGLQTGDVLSFSDQNGISGTYNAGTLTLTGASTVANYQTALRSITFATTNDDPTTARTVSFVVTDGQTTSTAATRGITITAVNDAPTVTAPGATPTYTEGAVAVTIDNTITVTDPDDTQLESGQARISADFQTGDILNFADQSAISGAYNSGTGVLTLTGSASEADYQTALRSITFSSTNVAPTASKTIEFKVNDGDTDSNLALQTVNITAVNDPPVVATSAGSSANTENLLSVIDAAITVTDPDDTNLNSAVVAITAGLQAGDELLFTAQNGITGVYTPGTGTLALTGVTTVATYQTALRTIEFRTANDNPTTSRTISFTVNDGDTNSNTDTKTITITPVNDAPTVTTSATPLAYTENQAATAIDTAINITDPDSTQLSGATVAVTANFSSAQDDLVFTNQLGITGTYNDTTGVLTLTGTTTIANYITALQSVAYQNVSDNPTPATRQISFQVTDTSAAASNIATRTINITAVNDPPINTVPGAQTVNEDTDRTFNAANSNLITVADVDAGSLQVTVSAANGTLTLSGTAGLSFSTGDGTNDTTMTFTGTIANINTALNGLVYRGNSNYNVTRGVETITIITNDQGNTGTGGALTDSDTIGVTVNAVNDAPTATAQAFAVQTNMRRTISVALSGAGGPTDPDTGDSGYTATFSLTSVTLPGAGCTGCVLENINLGAGTFDFEPPAGQTGAFTVNYTVTDSGNPGPGLTSATGTLTMNVSGTVIWFVNPTAPTNGTGTLAHPFQALAGVGGTPNDADDVDAANHRIFVYSNGTAAGSLALNSDEWLIGQSANPGSNFDTFFGLGTVPTGTIARPALNTPTTTLGGTITLATNAKVQGVHINSGVGAAMIGLSGNTGVDVTQTALTTTTGTPLSLNNVAGTLTFNDLDKNGAGTGITLTNVAAAVTVPTLASIANTTVAAVDIDGGTGAFSYAGAINNSISGGRTIEVTNRNTGAPGAVQFTGSINGAGTGVNLDNNDNGTISFSGGLTLSTTTNTAFNAINGGTVTATDPSGPGITPNNTLTTTTGTALNVQSTNIGAASLNFLSIASTGAPSGISLNATGASGGLTVTGNGGTCTSAATCTGGAIQNSTGAGISLTNVGGTVSLTRVSINNGGDDGIRGSTVGAFSLANSVVLTNGNAVGERGIDMIQLGGSGGISASTISGSSEHNVVIVNDTVNLTAFNVTGTTIATTNITTGDDGLQVLNTGSAAMTVSVTGSTFTDNKGDHFQAASDADASGSINVTFNNNTLMTTAANDPNVIGGGITINTSGTLDINFNVGSNSIQQAFDDAINLNLDPGSQAGATFVGTITGNTIGTTGAVDSGSESSNTITFAAKGAGTATVAITNNNVRQYGNGMGILVSASEGSPIVNATVTGNTVKEPGTFGINGIQVMAGATSGPPVDASTVCVNLTGNDATGSAKLPPTDTDIRLRQRFNTTIRLPGYAGANSDTAAVNTFVSGNNTGGPTVSSIHNVGGGGGGFVGGAACLTPP